MLLTLSNLYPRPDQPQRGLFNAQLFTAMGGSAGSRDEVEYSILNAVLVPEWRPWRWKSIRAWQDPHTDCLNTRYVPVGYVPVIGRSINWWLYQRGLASCAKAFEQCDAVLATWLYPDGVAAAALARQAGKPIWLKVHGTDRYHLDRPARRKHILHACEYAAGIICPAHSIKQQLVDRGFPESKLHVIPNGVNTTRFRYRPKQEARPQLRDRLASPEPALRVTHYALRLPPDDPTLRITHYALRSPNQQIILFIGNLVPIKGPDLLLDAFASPKSPLRITDYALLFLGSGPMLPALRRQADRLGIADRVTFLGSRPHAEIALWMNVADVLCLPSRSEGMPNVVLEAVASGLPVVATDVGDCRRVLADEPAARVVPTGNAEAMATALEDVLTTRIDRESLSTRHASRLSWEACAERHLELVEPLFTTTRVNGSKR